MERSKRIFTVILALFIVVLSGCGSDEAPAQPPPPAQNQSPQTPPSGQNQSPQTPSAPNPHGDPNGGGNDGAGNTYGYDCSFTSETYQYGGKDYPLCCGREGWWGFQACYVFVDVDDCGDYYFCWGSTAAFRTR